MLPSPDQEHRPAHPALQDFPGLPGKAHVAAEADVRGATEPVHNSAPRGRMLPREPAVVLNETAHHRPRPYEPTVSVSKAAAAGGLAEPVVRVHWPRFEFDISDDRGDQSRGTADNCGA